MREENNNGLYELKIPEFLLKENIFEEFIADKRCIRCRLNHVYEDTTIISDIDKKSWQKTVKNFREAAAKKKVQQKHIDMLDDSLAGNYQIIDKISQDNIDGNERHEQTNQTPKKVYSTYKYSENRKGVLHEAAIVSEHPCFIKYDKQSDKLVIVEKIEETGLILRPPNPEEYAHLPYEFTDAEELQYYLDRAKAIDVNSLYQRCKCQVRRYNDQDEHKLVLVTTDIAWSYYQAFKAVHSAVLWNTSAKRSRGDAAALFGHQK